jgi:photosystem II protein
MQSGKHNLDNFVDKFISKLFDRVVNASALQNTDMEDATLGKPGTTRAALPQATSVNALPMRAGGMHMRMGGMPGRRPVLVHAASLQFIKGQDETDVPEVKLSKSRKGDAGQATFLFNEPAVFEMGGANDDITGLYMVDDEGEIRTVDVQARFVNGKPAGIIAKHTMKSEAEWDRFMRFMERYAEEQGLGFTAAAKK